jgi:hypothetical protein
MWPSDAGWVGEGGREGGPWEPWEPWEETYNTGRRVESVTGTELQRGLRNGEQIMTPLHGKCTARHLENGKRISVLQGCAAQKGATTARFLRHQSQGRGRLLLDGVWDGYVVFDELGDAWEVLICITSFEFTELSKKSDTAMLQFSRYGAQGSCFVQLQALAIVARLEGDSYEHHSANPAIPTPSSIARVCNAIKPQGKDPISEITPFPNPHFAIVAVVTSDS